MPFMDGSGVKFVCTIKEHAGHGYFLFLVDMMSLNMPKEANQDRGFVGVFAENHFSANVLLEHFRGRWLPKFMNNRRNMSNVNVDVFVEDARNISLISKEGS